MRVFGVKHSKSVCPVTNLELGRQFGRRSIVLTTCCFLTTGAAESRPEPQGTGIAFEREFKYRPVEIHLFTQPLVVGKIARTKDQRYTARLTVFLCSELTYEKAPAGAHRGTIFLQLRVDKKRQQIEFILSDFVASEASPVEVEMAFKLAAEVRRTFSKDEVLIAK